MRKQIKPFKPFLCLSLLCCFSIITSFISIASSEYASVRFPNNLEISIPDDWEITSETDLDFAAVCHDEAGAPTATLNVKLYPRTVFSNYYSSFFKIVQLKSMDYLAEDEANAEAVERV